MSHSKRNFHFFSLPALTALSLSFSWANDCFAQSNQIQRLPQARQQRVYSLLDQIQNSFAEDDSALKTCNAAIAEFPQIGQFYLRRGDAYANKGDDKKALADYRHARKCDSTLANDSAEFASSIYCKQKKYDLALKELDTLPVNNFGLRGDPEKRISIFLQMGKKSLAESMFRKYRERRIAHGNWSDQILTRFPDFANLNLDAPQPNTTYSKEAFNMLKLLSAFETMPTKADIEKALDSKLKPGKSVIGDKTIPVGTKEFFKAYVDERLKQIHITFENGLSFIAANNLLKELNYKGPISDETFLYLIRKTPADPKMITFDFSGPYKGLKTATFAWNVVPDSPTNPFGDGLPVIDSALLIEMLKQLDAAPKPIDKARIEAITKCKLKQSKNIYPDLFSGMTELETVWRSGAGFSSQKFWSVTFTPDGAYLNDSRFYVLPGAEKVTKAGLDALFGPGEELQSNGSWRMDSSKNVSYKRPYGSITAVFHGDDKAARSIGFWWKDKSQYSTLEEFETQRTSPVLCDEAQKAIGKNEFKRAFYLLRLAHERGGLGQQSGDDKYALWKKIRAAYVALYEKKGDKARANYLRNVPCEKMSSDLLELESSRKDFPTLKDSENIPWRIIHPPEGLAYRLQGDGISIEIYRSSPNFRRCIELFGPMNDGADLFVKSVPADLFDSEYFGPSYYD